VFIVLPTFCILKSTCAALQCFYTIFDRKFRRNKNFVSVVSIFSFIT
jgi:hypothetical protein